MIGTQNGNGIHNHTIAGYNLKAVVQETGLKPDTLRAWERRYGIPSPYRTDGGHRLYSSEDIETLKWLVARQNEGMSISRAVTLWRQLEQEGKDPRLELPTVAEINPHLTAGPNMQQFCANWVEACLEFDEMTAEQNLLQALTLFSPENVCLHILQKGIAKIGMWWYEGKASAQQEHFASALATRRLEALIVGTPPPTRLGRVVIGCAPEEEHTFPPLLLTLFLRRRGWDVLYLGANVPQQHLLRTIEATEPRLVIMTAQTLPAAANLYEISQMMGQEHGSFGYGGLIFSLIPSVQKRIRGYYLGNSLEQTPLVIEGLLQQNRPMAIPPRDKVDLLYQNALNHFLERRARIEATIWEESAQLAIPPQELAEINRNMAKNILAALTLRDLDLVRDNLDWVDGLLKTRGYQQDESFFPSYIRLYTRATEKNLDQPGTLIKAWFSDLVATRHN